MSKDITIFVFRSVVSDWIGSTLRLGAIVGVSVANHRFGGASTWIDALAVILGFLSIIAIATKKDKNAWRGKARNSNATTTDPRREAARQTESGLPLLSRHRHRLQLVRSSP